MSAELESTPLEEPKPETPMIIGVFDQAKGDPRCLFAGGAGITELFTVCLMAETAARTLELGGKLDAATVEEWVFEDDEIKATITGDDAAVIVSWPPEEEKPRLLAIGKSMTAGQWFALGKLANVLGEEALRVGLMRQGQEQAAAAQAREAIMAKASRLRVQGGARGPN